MRPQADLPGFTPASQVSQKYIIHVSQVSNDKATNGSQMGIMIQKW